MCTFNVSIFCYMYQASEEQIDKKGRIQIFKNIVGRFKSVSLC
jgi:hypothetical protein